MHIGRFTIEQLTEGQFTFFGDGTINRVPLSKAIPSSHSKHKNGSVVGINPVYVTDGTHHILLDVGLGWGLDAGSPYTDISNVRTNLAIFGITPKDITHIILTHLHYDHVAGATFTNEQALTCPTFPNARYVVQETEWEFAVWQVQHERPTLQFYKLDDIYRLYADDFFMFIDDDEKEIIPGLSIIKTGGHTPGHQIIKISDDAQTAYFMGDLVPDALQLNYFDISNRSVNRVQAKNMKVNLLRKAFEKKAFLFFYHSVHSKVGQLEQDEEERYILKEI